MRSLRVPAFQGSAVVVDVDDAPAAHQWTRWTTGEEYTESLGTVETYADVPVLDLRGFHNANHSFTVELAVENVETFADKDAVILAVGAYAAGLSALVVGVPAGGQHLRFGAVGASGIQWSGSFVAAAESDVSSSGGSVNLTVVYDVAQRGAQRALLFVDGNAEAVADLGALFLSDVVPLDPRVFLGTSGWSVAAGWDHRFDLCAMSPVSFEFVTDLARLPSYVTFVDSVSGSVQGSSVPVFSPFAGRSLQVSVALRAFAGAVDSVRVAAASSDTASPFATGEEGVAMTPGTNGTFSADAVPDLVDQGYLWYRVATVTGRVATGVLLRTSLQVPSEIGLSAGASTLSTTSMSLAVSSINDGLAVLFGEFLEGYTVSDVVIVAESGATVAAPNAGAQIGTLTLDVVTGSASGAGAALVTGLTPDTRYTSVTLTLTSPIGAAAQLTASIDVTTLDTTGPMVVGEVSVSAPDPWTVNVQMSAYDLGASTEYYTGVVFLTTEPTVPAAMMSEIDPDKGKVAVVQGFAKTADAPDALEAVLATSLDGAEIVPGTLYYVHYVLTDPLGNQTTSPAVSPFSVQPPAPVPALSSNVGALALDGITNYVARSSFFPAASHTHTVSLWFRPSSLPASGAVLYDLAEAPSTVYRSAQSAFFNGAGRAQAGTALNLSGAHSISFWFKATAGANRYDILVDTRLTESGIGEAIFLRNVGGNAPEIVAFGASGSFAWNDNAWHHVLYTTDGSSQAVLYVDGQVKIANAGVWNALPTVTFGDRVINATPDQKYQGYLDEAAVFNVMLSTKQVETLYGSGVPPEVTAAFDASAVVAYWKLEGSGANTQGSNALSLTGVSFTSSTAASPPAPVRQRRAVTLDASHFQLVHTDGAATSAAHGMLIGQWNHIVAVWTPLVASVYLNGAHVSTIGIAGLMPYAEVPRLAIGRAAHSDAQYAHGAFDEIGYWNVALDAAAVAELYNAGQPTNLLANVGSYASSASLKAYYRFETLVDGLYVADNTREKIYALTAFNGPAIDDAPPRSLTVSQTPAARVRGPPVGAGAALRLDGATQYASATNWPVAPGAELTVSAWVRVWSADRFHAVYAAESAAGFVHFGVNADRAEVRTGSGTLTHSLVLARNRWYHLALTWTSSNEVTVYVDGVASSSAATWSLSPSGSPVTLTVGRAGSEYFHGLLDDVAVWSAALPVEDVRKVADGFGSLSQEPAARWTFDASTGADSTANARNLTVHGSPSFRAAPAARTVLGPADSFAVDIVPTTGLTIRETRFAAATAAVAENPFVADAVAGSTNASSVVAAATDGQWLWYRSSFGFAPGGAVEKYFRTARAGDLVVSTATPTALTAVAGATVLTSSSMSVRITGITDALAAVDPGYEVANVYVTAADGVTTFAVPDDFGSVHRLTGSANSVTVTGLPSSTRFTSLAATVYSPIGGRVATLTASIDATTLAPSRPP